MSITIGGKEASELYVGNKAVKEVWQAGSIVWPKHVNEDYIEFVYNGWQLPDYPGIDTFKLLFIPASVGTTAQVDYSDGNGLRQLDMTKPQSFWAAYQKRANPNIEWAIRVRIYGTYDNWNMYDSTWDGASQRQAGIALQSAYVDSKNGLKSLDKLFRGCSLGAGVSFAPNVLVDPSVTTATEMFRESGQDGSSCNLTNLKTSKVDVLDNAFYRSGFSDIKIIKGTFPNALVSIKSAFREANNIKVIDLSWLDSRALFSAQSAFRDCAILEDIIGIENLNARYASSTNWGFLLFMNGANSSGKIPTKRYGDLLINLAATANNEGVLNMNFNTCFYDSSNSAVVTARDYLINTMQWDLQDAGPA